MCPWRIPQKRFLQYNVPWALKNASYLHAILFCPFLFLARTGLHAWMQQGDKHFGMNQNTKYTRIILNKAYKYETTWFACENICRRSSGCTNRGANRGTPTAAHSACAICLERKMHAQSLSSAQIDPDRRPVLTAKTWARTVRWKETLWH